MNLDFEKMEEKELTMKFFAIFGVIKGLLGTIGGHISLFAKLTRFYFKHKGIITKISDSNDSRVIADNSVELLEAVLKLKKDKPKAFEEIFELLGEVVAKYKTDSSLRDDIIAILDDKKA